MFTAKTPLPGDIYCHPPDNIFISNSTSLWIKAAHVSGYSVIEDEESYDICMTYSNAVERYLNSSNGHKDEVVSCTRFQHKVEDSYFSLIHQYDLYCDRSALVPLTQSFHLLGVLIGGIIANYLLKS